MILNIKFKIWFTVSSIVLVFAYFLYFHFPKNQRDVFEENFNKHTQSLANTVGLGVNIALTEQNFQGISTAMHYARSDEDISFVAILQSDTVDGEIVESVFLTFPEGISLPSNIESSDSLVIKRSPIESELLVGYVVVAASTDSIKAYHASTQIEALIITGVILLFGLLFGFFLSQHISKPLDRLRRAAKAVREGDLTQFVEVKRKDEIGSLTRSFNKMITGLAIAENEILEVNEELRSMNDEIQGHVKLINSSINYAERIQKSILPDVTDIKAVFPESFVYYKPRDIVSGDIYYFVEEGDFQYIAAVDCTGHGVPGGFMSMIAYTLLNQVISLQKVENVGRILEELHVGVNRELGQGKLENVQDGMDIVLCRVDLKNRKLQFSGAHNSLYLYREGNYTRYKGNRWAIGGEEHVLDKETLIHDIELEDGDAIYLFSDGYQDQFGGPNGEKKFQTRRFRELLLSIQDKSMMQQCEILDREFVDWKGAEIQTDDVLVMGIKFDFK